MEVLNVGDLIVFRHPDVPLPEIQAVVIEDTGKYVEVMSTLLVPFQHSGVFDRGRMEGCFVFCKAEDAIPMESHREWTLGQRLVMNYDKGFMECNIVAAFDGVVVGRTDDGKLLTCGVNHCEVVC